MATNYTKEITDDYCVVDVETTGLSSKHDRIIEIALLRVRNNVAVARYSQLINPRRKISSHTSELTGITNDMVAEMPTIDEVEKDVLNFLQQDLIVGHNVSFDIRFLNSAFNNAVQNKYTDTLVFAKKLYPELPNHKLSYLTDYLHVSKSTHRALADCVATKELYDAIKATMLERNLSTNDLFPSSKISKGSKRTNLASIVPTSDQIDEDSFFYGQHVTFTGKLERMERKEAAQIVANLGGIAGDNVTKKTNYLILGDNDYNASLHGEKSSKHKKAEKMQMEGNDIEILDESTFYAILQEEGY